MQRWYHSSARSNTGRCGLVVLVLYAVASGCGDDPTEPAADDPRLGVSPDTLDMAALDVSLPMVVTNVGGGTLDWTAAADPAWLTVDPGQGSTATSDTVAVTVTAAASLRATTPDG